jgi:hypothetical protein
LTGRDRTTVGIEQRIECLGARDKTVARLRDELYLHHLPNRDVRRVALRQAKIDRERLGIFQIQQICAVLDVLAEVGAAQPHRAVKRRVDVHALQARPRRRHLGSGHLQIGLTFVQHAPGHEVLRHQIFIALQGGLSNRELRLGLSITL